MKRRPARMTQREMGMTVVLSIAIIWFAFLVAGIYEKEKIARTTVQETRVELAALEARKNTLAATVNGLETERGHEASLRETFGVAKPGEDVIIVVPQEEIAPPPEPTFWDKVKEFFGI
jgi:cell division protein FtsB